MGREKLGVGITKQKICVFLSPTLKGLVIKFALKEKKTLSNFVEDILKFHFHTERRYLEHKVIQLRQDTARAEYEYRNSLANQGMMYKEFEKIDAEKEFKEVSNQQVS